MSTRFTLLSLALGFAFLLTACDQQKKNKREGITPPPTVEKTFKLSYPNATKTEFEKKGEYYVAEFKNSGISAKAWFDREGVWVMDKAEIDFSKLPAAVTTAFQQGDYGKWKVEDSDVFTLRGGKAVYKIEVEGNKKEIDLYYSSEGALIQTLDDNKNNDLTLITPDIFKDPLVN